jgi:hypothetical protein
VRNNAADNPRNRQSGSKGHHASHAEAKQEDAPGIDRISAFNIGEKPDEPRGTVVKLSEIGRTNVAKIIPRVSPISILERIRRAGADHEESRVEIINKPEEIILVRAPAME